VKPRIEHHLAEEFMPQSVPAYAAAETFKTLRKKYPDFSYKEATLNPTNPANRTVEWESDIVNSFRNSGVATGEINGERDTPSGRMLYIARPIQIKDPGLPRLPQRAGRGAGLDDQALRREQRLRLEAHGDHRRAGRLGADVAADPQRQRGLQGIHGLARGDLRGDLHRAERDALAHDHPPISRMSASADKISTGDFDVAEFQAGKDEIGVLGTSFNRMRRSLQKAMKLIER
jgi:protein-histidine pros-kinase